MEFDVMIGREHLYPTGTEEACAVLLFEMKWPSGYSCPRCMHPDFYTVTTRRLPLYECRLCRHQASLLTGSIFEGSKTDLTKWFTALSLISSDGGISAARLHRTIGVTYKTAWTMLQKIRYAIAIADTETPLLGTVLVNAAAYNRPLNSSFQASPTEHPFFVGAAAADNNPTEYHYVKMKLISKEHIQNRFVTDEAVTSFSQNEIGKATTSVTFVTKRYSSARFVPLLKLAGKASRWINGCFMGLGRKHLQAYLDEYCYRMNSTKASGSPLLSLSRLCMKSPRFTYNQLINLCS